MEVVTSNDGTKIAYDKTGHGPALILVAGMFSYRKYPGQIKLATLLSEYFTVYNYDRRGRGDSTDIQPYSVQKEIDDLNALIDAAGGSAYVWGLSSGAALSLRAAAQGAHITKLIVQEPPFVVDPFDRMPPANAIEHLAELVATGQRGEAVEYAMTQVMGAPKFVITLMHIMPGAWPKLTAVANTLPYDVAIVHEYQKGKPLPAGTFKSVTMPTLVMVGPESPAWFMHSAQAVAKALPNAQFLAKKGLGRTKKLSVKLIATEIIAFLGDENVNSKTTIVAEGIIMRKLIVSEFVTVDGVFEDPGGSEKLERGGWAFAYDRGDEGDKFKDAELKEADISLFGAKTYDGFAEAWPSRTGEYAEKLNGMPKYVVSSKPKQLTWQNSRLISGNVVEEISKLKSEDGGTILVAGSGTLANFLLDNGLVDELRLMVYPVLLGRGRKLFAERNEKISFNLMEVKPVGHEGIVVLTYCPKIKDNGVKE